MSSSSWNGLLRKVEDRETIHTIVLELECVLCQTSGRDKFAAFRQTSRAGAAGNKSLGQTIYRYILVYRSTYIAQTIINSGIIVCTRIYFTSTSYTFIYLYTVINRDKPWYTHDILYIQIWSFLSRVWGFQMSLQACHWQWASQSTKLHWHPLRGLPSIRRSSGIKCARKPERAEITPKKSDLMAVARCCVSTPGAE